MKKDSSKRSCPITTLLSMISKKWTLMIIKNIDEGASTYSDIEKAVVGITPSTLSTRLKELQKMDFIEKNITSETPVKIEYKLTSKGKSFSGETKKMYEWTKKWM